MASTPFPFLSATTRKEVVELTKDLELKDPRVFVRIAVEGKILDVKRKAFSSLSDRFVKALRRKRIRPKDVLAEFKS